MALYQRAKAGTKVLIEDYINEIRDALNYLAPRDFPAFPGRAYRVFPARQPLLRALGPYVERRRYPGLLPLWRHQDADSQGLCPAVISAPVPGPCGIDRGQARTDAEYLQLFENNYLARALTENRGNVKISFRVATRSI